MELENDHCDEKKVYVPPKVLATYKKEDLEEAVMPQVQGQSGGGCGCGCGGGVLIP